MRNPTLREELELELARQRAILERNEAKRWDRATPARSRFAYAAHATKAHNRIARLELELERVPAREARS